jgi:hypothetical protein
MTQDFGNKSSAHVATLMQFACIEKIDEIQCPERDRQGWVVLNHFAEKHGLSVTA